MHFQGTNLNPALVVELFFAAQLMNSRNVALVEVIQDVVALGMYKDIYGMNMRDVGDYIQ